MRGHCIQPSHSLFPFSLTLFSLLLFSFSLLPFSLRSTLYLFFCLTRIGQVMLQSLTTSKFQWLNVAKFISHLSKIVWRSGWQSGQMLSMCWLSIPSISTLNGLSIALSAATLPGLSMEPSRARVGIQYSTPCHFSLLCHGLATCTLPGLGRVIPA